MKSLKILPIALLLLLMASSLPAVAGVANMNFISADGNSYNGVASYPYYFTVNGNPDFLMCISYNEHITNGETWQATVYSVDGYAALPGVGTQKAGEIAYLFTLALADHGANSDVNAVAWNINEGVPALTPSAVALYNQVTGMTFSTGEFPGLRVYVPIDGTQSWAGEVPQVFYGTPEPSTLLTLGSGVP